MGHNVMLATIVAATTPVILAGRRMLDPPDLGFN
jgi:hypothetical protein